jgi:phosphoglycerate dehydrogenase-like enzyme
MGRGRVIPRPDGPVRALVIDPDLLSGVPAAWRRRHPERADEVDFVVPGSAEVPDLVAVGGGAQVLIGCRTSIGAELLDRLPEVRFVQQCSAGYDNVDLDALSRRGIALARVEGSGVNAVAEHTMMCLLALARRLCAANASTHAGGWMWGELYDRIWELRGQRLGLIGFGAIGREVARLADAFGMEVVYTRRREGEDPGAAGLARRVGLDELLATSRAVSVHCPLTPSTEGLLDRPAFERMRADAVLVNTARGGIVVEEDLAAAVRDGVIAGAAVDTFGAHADRISPTSPLIGVPGILLTPHSAGCTHENLERTFHEAAVENLAAFVRGEPLRGLVLSPVQVGG